MTRSVVLQQLAAAIAAVRVPHPTRVAIDGVDGAGKTTLADELVTPLEATRRQIIRASVDGFHRPRAERYCRGRDSPEAYFRDSFDYPALRLVLLDPLGPAGDRMVRRTTFDYRTDQPVHPPSERAAPDAILLFDGVFLQRTELAGAWDFRIWVDAPFEVTVPRAVQRDSVHTPTIATQYERRYVPGQRLYLEECRRESADAIVHNSDFDSPVLQVRLH